MKEIKSKPRRRKKITKKSKALNWETLYLKWFLAYFPLSSKIFWWEKKLISIKMFPSRILMSFKKAAKFVSNFWSNFWRLNILDICTLKNKWLIKKTNSTFNSALIRILNFKQPMLHSSLIPLMPQLLNTSQSTRKVSIKKNSSLKNWLGKNMSKLKRIKNQELKNFKKNKTFIKWKQNTYRKI